MRKLTSSKGAKKRAATAKTGAVVEKKKRHWHPGTVAKRQIRALQKSDALLFANAPFDRMCRNIVAEITAAEPSLEPNGKNGVKFSSNGLDVLKKYIQYLVVTMFRKGQHTALFSKRVRLQAKDMEKTLSDYDAQGIFA